jgi:hypothetical protein
MDAPVQRRRIASLLFVGALLTALSFGFGHRGVHAARGLIVPGAGLYDHRNWPLGVALTLGAIVATYAWLRWGMDWLVAAVLIASMALSAAFAYSDHPATAQPVAAAHEFPLVVLVMGGISWVRLAWRRTPIGRRRAARREPTPSISTQCHAAAIAAIAGAPVAAPPDTAALERRARRIGIAARGRFAGDPLHRDHALARATLALTGELDATRNEAFLHDGSIATAGVPASEPGWVRLLDGTLAAIALQRAGAANAAKRWAAALDDQFALRRGHRPDAVWTPLGLRGPRAEPWAHAAATALARSAGWLATDDDWHALRKRTLAAAARGNAIAEDERLVAAGRVWLRLVDDEQASRIIGRVTIHRDPVALALAALADALTADPQLLVPSVHEPRSTR